MKSVSLSKAAAADLEAIDDYTIEHFGLNQAIRTSERFRAIFDLLAAMPRSGQLREEISPPGRHFGIALCSGASLLSTKQRSMEFASPGFSTAHEILSPNWSATPGTIEAVREQATERL